MCGGQTRGSRDETKVRVFTALNGCVTSHKMEGENCFRHTAWNREIARQRDRGG